MWCVCAQGDAQGAIVFPRPAMRLEGSHNVRTAATTTYGIIVFPRPSGVYVLRATCIVCASPKHSALEFSERTLVGVYHPETLDDP
jgi:hypothetical protein